ncbi:polysaccharide biosynthesis/export family protein [Paraburkholderia guartelaensis]
MRSVSQGACYSPDKLRRGRSGLTLMVLSVAAALSACSLSPGMRMEQPATLAAASQIGPDGKNEQTAALGVPVTNIDIALIQKLRDAQATSPDGTSAVSVVPRPYTIGRGDVLQITVWDHPELAVAAGAQPQATTRAADAPPGFVVDQDGTLQFPYAGRVRVAGLQPEQIQVLLTQRLSKSFQDPQVSVRVASYRAKQIYIEGEVHTPGSQPLNDIPMTFYDAVSRAGGFESTADQSRVVLVRNGVSERINLTEMAVRGQNPSRILLQDGDLLRVLPREDSGVYVMGEVNKPVTALPMRDGRLTLSEAILQAGSINSNTADAAQVYVIRGGVKKQPEIFHLDAASPVAMILANQFELHPKDVVYVDGNGLVRFSRVLSLLLPAINAGLTAAIVTK